MDSSLSFPAGTCPLFAAIYWRARSLSLCWRLGTDTQLSQKLGFGAGFTLKEVKASTPCFANFSPAFCMKCCSSQQEDTPLSQRRWGAQGELPNAFGDYLLLRPVLTPSSVASTQPGFLAGFGSFCWIFLCNVSLPGEGVSQSLRGGGPGWYQDRLHWARQDAGCCSASLQTSREMSIQAPQGGCTAVSICIFPAASQDS